MTRDEQKDLLAVYRKAVLGRQDDIADLLEKLILGEMGKSVYIPATRGIKVGDESLEPPWKATCGPDIVPHGTTVECTGIDHLSKEVTI